MSSMHASMGFFLLRDGADLSLASGSPGADLSQELREQARLAWQRELDAPHDDNNTKTLDVSVFKVPSRTQRPVLWTSPDGHAFEHRVLSTYRDSLWVPVGLVIFERQTESSLLRQAHVESLCNAFIDCGEVPATSVPARE